MEKIRIQKLLADAGYCSRRKAEELISGGKIKVNGHPVKLGDKATAADLITVNGERVYLPRKKTYRYLMLHKPRGYVTTTSDELDRRCVMDLLEDVEERVYPIGRLDKDSEGLLLLTDDGELAHKMLSPKSHVYKQYRAQLDAPVEEADIQAFAAGVAWEGEQYAPARLWVEQDPRAAFVEIREGRFHQVKRMFQAQDGAPAEKAQDRGPLAGQYTTGRGVQASYPPGNPSNFPLASCTKIKRMIWILVKAYKGPKKSLGKSRLSPWGFICYTLINLNGARRTENRTLAP